MIKDQLRSVSAAVLARVAVALFFVAPTYIIAPIIVAPIILGMSAHASAQPPNTPFPGPALPGQPASPPPFTSARSRSIRQPAPGPPATGYELIVESAQIIARVGDQIIQAGDVTGAVDAVMEQNGDSIPEDRWNEQRQLLIQKFLKRHIENKLVFVDAMRNIPEEAWPNIEQQITEQFNKDYVKTLMKQAEVNSLAELETALIKNGSSLKRRRQSFLEQSVAAQWVQQNTKDKQPIGHQEMHRYYQEHLADYDNSAKAEWQELTVEFASHASKAEAYQAIVQMGNDVLIRRIPFADVAIAHSDGVTARSGGKRDWTTPGALKSKVLDEAIFSVPVGSLSQILEDTDAFHIIQVTERVDQHRTPFRDAQIEIREEIQKTRRKKAQDEYFARIKDEIRVWTIFDERDGQQEFLDRPEPE